MAHNVTVVHVPLIRQASVFLQRVLRIMGTCVLFWAPKLEVCCFLQFGRMVCLQSLFLCRVIQRQSKEGCPPLAARQCFLASAATIPRTKLQRRQRPLALHLDPSALARKRNKTIFFFKKKKKNDLDSSKNIKKTKKKTSFFAKESKKVSKKLKKLEKLQN